MTDPSEGRYLVLHSYLGHEDFLRVARREGWSLEKTYPSEGERDPFEEVWVDKRGLRAIHYIDDPISSTRHLWIRGPELDDLLFTVVRLLPIYPPEELVAEASEGLPADEAIDVLLRLAVTFPSYDADVFKVYSDYLAHPLAVVRKAAVQALGYRGWPQGVELLGEHAKVEPDPAVREYAQRVFDELRNLLPGGAG